jgi:hypothetical protein
LASELSGGKGKIKGGEKFESQAGVAPGTSPAEGAAPFEAKGKKNKGTEVRGQPMPGATQGVGQAGNEPLASEPGGGKGKHKGGENITSQHVQPIGGEGNPPGEGKRNRKAEQMNAAGTPNGPPPPPQAAAAGRNRGGVQGQPQTQEQPQGGQGKGKKNKGQASPGPSPQ